MQFLVILCSFEAIYQYFQTGMCFSEPFIYSEIINADETSLMK